MMSGIQLPLAILGATSRLGEDFILSASKNGVSFALYARRPEKVRDFLLQNGLPNSWYRGSIYQFEQDSIDTTAPPFSGVVNFIGVGDPAKAKELGRLIFQITQGADQLAIRHLERFPKTPYIFMSSGAVYGAGFLKPASQDTPSIFNSNNLLENEYYGLAKLYAESTHRSLKYYNIIDIRVFNYISRRIDQNARFLITDIIRAIKQKNFFETTDQIMVRDYLHPHDLCSLILNALKAPAGSNLPVDAFTLGPISKEEVLNLMRDEFGLKYRIIENNIAVNATGSKPFYYSNNNIANTLGYIPTRSSADAIREEMAVIFETACK